MAKGQFQFSLRALFVALTVASVLAYPLGWLIAFYTIEPSFSVSATRVSQGYCELEIIPNFIVNSVRRISVSSPKGLVFSSESVVLHGPQRIGISTIELSGSPVVVECDLQYDRIAPSLATVSKSISLP